MDAFILFHEFTFHRGPVLVPEGGAALALISGKLSEFKFVSLDEIFRGLKLYPCVISIRFLLILTSYTVISLKSCFSIWNAGHTEF